MENTVMIAQIVAEPSLVRSVLPCRSPLEVADVDGKYTTRPEGGGDSDERPLDRLLVGEVVERMADGDDCVARRNRVIGQDELGNRLGARSRLACKGEHRRRRVGGDHDGRRRRDAE